VRLRIFLFAFKIPNKLGAVVHALKIWRHYLLRNKSHIYTDHKSLKYIFTQSELNMRQQRRLELIKDYDLEIHYHPGKANVVANALSHKPNYQMVQPLFEDGFNQMHPEVLCHIQLSCLLESQVIEGQNIDKGISHIKEKIKDDPKTQF